MFRNRDLLLAASLSAILAMSAGGASAAPDDCFVGFGDDCLDDPASLPDTGHYDDAETGSAILGPSPNASAAGGDYGAVRRTEREFFYAHNICRHIDNRSSSALGMFVPMQTRAEWVAMYSHPPSGSIVTRCCIPVSVSLCGETMATPFAKAGDAVTLQGEGSRQIVLTCGGAAGGIGVTQDTAWSSAVSGNCPGTGGDDDDDKSGVDRDNDGKDANDPGENDDRDPSK